MVTFANQQYSLLPNLQTARITTGRINNYSILYLSKQFFDNVKQARNF